VPDFYKLEHYTRSIRKTEGHVIKFWASYLQGPAFGTTASVYDKQRVVATASGPTFATEDKTVHILLLTGVLSSS